MISVVGVIGGEVFGEQAAAAVATADVVLGARRHLDRVKPAGDTIELTGSLDAVLDRIDVGRRVCVLASGDPGFFGIVRLLAERFGAAALEVHPAPSSVSLAFARLGLPWDDAVVVSAHGRPLDAAVAAIRQASGSTVAVLTSPDNSPAVLGRALLGAGISGTAAVVSRIGEDDETITRTDIDGLVTGDADPLSIVVLPARRPDRPTLAWGLPEADFAHRDGMITKAEVRAVAMGKLALPRTGVLWDLGAGSGSVGIECARLCPGLDVYAVERSEPDAARIAENAAAHGVRVLVVAGEAPEATEALPDPDRVFVGGGGIEVLRAAQGRLRPGGVVVATYALVDRAVEAWRLLGNLVEVGVHRGVATAGGVRLAAENPVFVAWG
jgi:precorrin-6Y C5,15-methyltransferase (decarboxylating)